MVVDLGAKYLGFFLLLFPQNERRRNLNILHLKAELLLLKLIHLFAREVLSVKILEIEETKTT